MADNCDLLLLPDQQPGRSRKPKDPKIKEPSHAKITPKRHEILKQNKYFFSHIMHVTGYTITIDSSNQNLNQAVMSLRL